MSQTWQHSPGRLQPEAPDQRPGLSPVSIAGLSSVISESTLHDIAKHIIAVRRNWIVRTPGAQFRLRCFRQTLSVRIFLLTFPCHAWTAIPPRADGPPSLSQIEALRPINLAQRMPLSSALRFLGLWSGPMALAGSRPVYVYLQTIYGLNSGIFLFSEFFGMTFELVLAGKS